MKCIIAEDEFLVRQSLKMRITKMFPEIEIVSEPDHLEDMFLAIEKHHPDFILLDINFPDGNSVEAIQKYSGVLPYLIFITSYPNFALDAFRLEAVDYLLKPVEDSVLEKSIQKCLRYIDREKSFIKPTQIIRPEIPNPGKIMIPSQSGYYLLEIQEIIRMAADINYTRIYVKDKPPILVAITLKYFESALKDSGFFRVHKSHLVNLNHIERYQKTADGGILTLIEDASVPLSKNVRSEFHQALQRQVILLGSL
jgi:two-component system LytT family response regulator